MAIVTKLDPPFERDSLKMILTPREQGMIRYCLRHCVLRSDDNIATVTSLLMEMDK